MRAFFRFHFPTQMKRKYDKVDKEYSEKEKAKHAKRQRQYKKKNYDKVKEQNTAAQRKCRAKSSEEQKQRARRKNANRMQKCRQEKKKKKLVPNFSTTAEELDGADLSFENFEQDVEVATMLFYLNLGYGRYLSIDDLPSEAAKEKLKKEIDSETCTAEEQDEIIDRFLEAQGRGGYQQKDATHGRMWKDAFESRPESRDAYVTVCGLCGIKQPERNGCEYTEVALKDMEQFIELTSEELEEFNNECNRPALLLPVNDSGDLAEFDLYKLRSVYRSKTDPSVAYFVHPEFVHQNGEEEQDYTFVCPDCMSYLDRMCVPPNCEANGVHMPDFSRLPLTMPNLFELNILARYRMYNSVIKIQSNTQFGSRANYTGHTMKGHAILFQHDAPDVALLPLVLGLFSDVSVEDENSTEAKINDMLDRFLTLNFVGPAGKLDLLSKRAIGSAAVRGRSYVIYQWKAVLSHVNNQYKNDPPLPSFPAFRRVVNLFNDALVKKSARISDNESLEREKELGDDVTKSQTKILVDDDPLTDISTNDQDMSLTYSCVRGMQQKTDAEKEQEFVEYLELIASCFNIDADNLHDKTRKWKSHRVSFPDNVYGTSDAMLAGAFPHIFLYGTAYGKEMGCLNRVQLRHLLLHFTNVPGTCRELYFYLFNEMLRHGNIINMSAKVKSNPEAFASYASYLNSTDFEEEVKEALLLPSSKAAERVFSKVAPILSVSRKNSVLGPLDNVRLTSEMFALFRTFGPFCNWITIAPDDISNPTIFRLTMRASNNFSIPAVATDDFLNALRQNSTVLISENVSIPVNFQARATAAMNNPVATALEYINLLDNVYSILFGVQLADTQLNPYKKNVRTRYYKDNPKGIYGHSLAAIGITEPQHRGSLHTHLLLLGNLPPQLLQSVAEYPDLVQHLTTVLDTMYCAEVPRSNHIEHLLEKSMVNDPSYQEREAKIQFFVPAALRTPPNPLTCPEEWKQYSSNNAIHKQLHDHTFTCHRGKVGEVMCRLLFERPLASETRVVQLHKQEEEEDDEENS